MIPYIRWKIQFQHTKVFVEITTAEITQPSEIEIFNNIIYLSPHIFYHLPL